jgi:hypothetical protein
VALFDRSGCTKLFFASAAGGQFGNIAPAAFINPPKSLNRRFLRFEQKNEPLQCPRLIWHVLAIVFFLKKQQRYIFFTF